VISRHWKGIAKPDQAEAYVRHLTTETFPRLATMAGFVRASILKRAVGRGTEFQIVTVWESIDAIRAFAGEDVEVAVVPEVAQEMMLEYDTSVTHYEVVEARS
jgi:heme-degrading monooxygenase HmoA